MHGFVNLFNLPRRIPGKPWKRSLKEVIIQLWMCLYALQIHATNECSQHNTALSVLAYAQQHWLLLLSWRLLSLLVIGDHFCRRNSIVERCPNAYFQSNHTSSSEIETVKVHLNPIVMFQFLRFSIFFLTSRVLFLSVFFLYMTQKFTWITASTMFFKRRKLGELVKDPIMGPWIKRGKSARVRDSCL